VAADGSPASPSTVAKPGPGRRPRPRPPEDDTPRVSLRDTLRQHRHNARTRTRHAMPHIWPVTKSTIAQAWADRIFGLAAEAGFWALLSITPLLLVLVGAIGYLTPLFGSKIVVEVEQKILRAAGHFLAPQAVDNVLKPVLTDVVQHGRGGIISISFILALWTGSTAMNTYVNTISISYGMRHVRSAVRARLVAFVLYLGALLAGAVALPLRGASQPTLAPLTALLVVQVSLSQTQRSAPGGCRGYRTRRLRARPAGIRAGAAPAPARPGPLGRDHQVALHLGDPRSRARLAPRPASRRSSGRGRSG